jgi:transcriptional regulator with XRE-family HTH domain
VRSVLIDSFWGRMHTQRMSTHPSSDFVPEWTDGDKLRKVRRHLGLTQDEFAARLGVNAATYTAWENDRNRIKNLKAVARRVKQMTGTPLWWWFDTEPPNPPGAPLHGQRGDDDTPDDGGVPISIQPVGWNVAA